MDACFIRLFLIVFFLRQLVVLFCQHCRMPWQTASFFGFLRQLRVVLFCKSKLSMKSFFSISTTVSTLPHVRW